MVSPSDKEQLKQAFMAKAEAVFEQALERGEQAPLTLSQIEATVGSLKFELTRLLMESMIAVQARRQLGPGPRCARCGSEMHAKGQKERVVLTSQGEIGLKRGYYDCATCRRGLFPPGRTGGTEPAPLE